MEQDQKKPYVHVITSKGQQFIGRLLERHDDGAVQWVRLGPVYAYQIIQTQGGGLARQVAPPALLADSGEVECIVEQITHIPKETSFEIEDLFRDGERARQELQQASSRIATPPAAGRIQA